jgi:hypothetical protein
MSMVCEWFGLKTTQTVFVGLGSKPVATVFAGLTSKPVVTVSSGLTSKSAVGFLVKLQNQSGGLGLKIIMTVSWFVSQNQAGFGLSIVP